MSDLLLQPDSQTQTPARREPVPLLIAGPCSAETREQVMETAWALRDAGIRYFRAGVWKPRTRPDTFSGIGEEALEWLQEVRRETGLHTAVEVANARHAEAALKAGVDLLWIGARSSVNPFTVQEIADALQGLDLPVMVKNPINPDLDLWIGAIERVQRAVKGEVIACHRGFNVYGKHLYRNAPLWEIPIELKRRMPDLPLICDPSHISGKRDLVAGVARKALDLGYEGLMIETHPRPAEAWSDAAQQLEPQELKELLRTLHFRLHSVDDRQFKAALSYHRTEIDALDERLLELLSERLELARRIGAIKRENNVAFYQHNRWDEVLRHIRDLARRHHLREDFVEQLFSAIHLESLDIQGE